MKLTLILSGPRAGFTGTLRGHRFVKGETVIEGSPQNVEATARYLARTHQAFPAGSAELKERMKGKADGVQHIVQAPAGPGSPEGLQGDVGEPARKVQDSGDVQRDGPDSSGTAGGGAGLGAGGSGPADTGLHPEKVKAIRNAVRNLDPKVDEHWTEEGLPSIEVVSATTGDQNITRRMIEVVEPKWTRETATAETEL